MGNGWGSTRILFAAVWIVALTGCSASDYAKPITTFADATTATDAALNDLNKTATDNYTAFLAQRARTDLGIIVAPGDGECADTSTRCRIVLEDPNAPAKAQNYPPDPLLGKSVALMGDIRTYAQNLAAVVADDSAAQAATHVNAALGSIESLANTVADADGKAKGSVPNFATPVGAAANWVLGKYADHVKLEGLKAATKAADPIIQRAAALFKKEAIFGSQTQRNELTASFRNKIRAYQSNRGDVAKLDDAVAAAKKYDDLLVARPEVTFQKMGEAHAALTTALNNPDASWPQVLAKIQDFAAQAEQLAKVAKDLIALGQKK